MPKFFNVPFAANGDRTTIPDGVTQDGSVSYAEGWTPDYERPLDSDVHAKPVGRREMNGVLNSITSAIRVQQTQAYPDYITAADNGGTQYPYTKGVVVRFNGAFYVSLADNNTALPTDASKWQPIIYQRANQSQVDNGEGDYLVVTPPMLKAMIDERLKDIASDLAPNLLPVGACVLWFSPKQIPAGWLKLGDSGRFDTVKNPKLAAIYPDGVLPDPTDLMLKMVSGRSNLAPGAKRAGNINQHYHQTGRMSGDYGAEGDDYYVILRGGVNTSEQYSARGVFGEMNGTVGGTFPTGQSGKVAGTTNARADAELLPAHMGVCVIIKTDQADEVDPTPTPTNIVVSPGSANVEVGKTQQFTAQVVPAELAGQYPVTWTSSDTAVGTINASGLFTAKTAGSTDIVATISTGLSVRVSVRCDVLLTAVSLATIPDQVTGDSYALVVSKTPSNASENLVYTSNNTGVASVTADGTLTSVGEGTAAITVRGEISGVTTSRIVNVTAASVDAKYLLIKNNLSEIQEEGVASQAAARSSLGLGALATKDALTAKDVGAVTLAPTSLPRGVNLNTITEPCELFQNVSSNALPEFGYPEAVAGALRVYRTGVDAGACRQVYMPYNSTVEYRRYGFGDPLVFSAWEAK